MILGKTNLQAIVDSIGVFMIIAVMLAIYTHI